MLRRDVPVGHPDFGKPIRCDHPSHAEEARQRLAKISGLRPEDTHKTLSAITPNDGNEALLKAARRFLKHPRGWLYLWGGPGNAKSETLIALVNELNKAGQGPAMYVKFVDLIDYMRQAFEDRTKREKLIKDGRFDEYDDAGYIKRFDRIRAIKILAIDELDKARMTQFAQEFRFNILDERYRAAIAGETMTLFASNSDPSELPEAINSRILDGRFKVVHVEAGDARPHMAWGDENDDDDE